MRRRPGAGHHGVDGSQAHRRLRRDRAGRRPLDGRGGSRQARAHLAPSEPKVPLLRPAAPRLQLRSVMAFEVRPVEYHYANVRDELGAAYHVLSQLAERGVDLVAFTAVPAGPALAQFALFPEDPAKLVAEAQAAG